MTRFQRWLWLSASCLLALGSCQKLDLCDGGSCDPDSTHDGSDGGADGPDALAGAGNEAAGASHDAGGAAGAASDAGASGDGGAGASSQTPLACEPSRADCDGSRLTGCETNLTWSVRHCSGCGVACDDACQDNTCLDTSLLVSDVGVNAFASAGTYAFAVLSRLDATSSFARIRRETGTIDELIPQLGDSSAQLAIGDRVYLLQSDEGLLRSFSIDGTDLEIEQVIDARSVGAYPDGTYYLSRLDGDGDTDTIDTLYWRPNAASSWQAIRQQTGAGTSRIWSSSAHGVVYVAPDASDVDQLYLLDGSELIPFGPLPANATEALATGSGITILTHDEYAPLNELWWLRTGADPVRYAVSPDGLSPRMRAYRDVVVLSLADGNSGYVERFDANGAVGGRIGLRLGSELLGLDDDYLFHTVTDDWFHWRVLRTKWSLFGL